jgi:pectate lyase
MSKPPRIAGLGGLAAAAALLALPAACDIASLVGGSASAERNGSGSSTVHAFPEAEGFGANTVGGRGGRVLEVTNLDDGGAGSLRDAVEASGPRIVVFRVDGTIEHHTPLKIEHPYITIAGQSAPGGGITLSGEEVRVQTHDVVIRHLRIRTGDVVPPVDGWDNRDVINFGKPEDLGGTYNVVLDHCSFSWSVDETLTTWYQTHDVTVQACILSEALFHSKHPEGPHSMGVLISDDSERISLHHNLLAHINGRSPQIAGGSFADVRNNVVYNWGEYAGLIKEAGARVNFVGNYYRPGPDQGTSWSLNSVKLHTDVAGLELFIDDNIDPICPTGTEDNWDILVWTNNDQPVTDRSMRLGVELAHPATTTYEPADALAWVLANAGATKPERDSIDARVVADVQDGTGAIIDSPADVGGWITMWQGTPPADGDHDGMPDAWETAHGLDPADPADGAKDRNGDGYTNVEEYLNGLAR